MSDTLELKDLRAAVRHRWRIPVVLALAGAGLGVTAAADVAPVYRSHGTLLVGPVNGTVIRSTTLRASESLASFYSDLARRQIVLDPVTRTLGLDQRWDQLRNHVSAVTPDQNPRLITVTVLGSSPTQTQQTAEQILRQLVSLSPNPAVGSDQQFVADQTRQLKAAVERVEGQVQRLNARLATSRNPQVNLDLRRQLTEDEKLLNDWRHTYVELNAIDLSTDAGGLQIIDDVTTARSSNAAGMLGKGVLGGVLGAVLGAALVVMPRRRRRLDEPADAPITDDVAPEPDTAVVERAEPVEPVVSDGGSADSERPQGESSRSALTEEPDEPVLVEDPETERSDRRIVVRVTEDRLERVKAAVRPSEPEGTTEREHARATAPEGATRPVRKVETGKPQDVTPVQLAFGHNGSVSVATAVRGDE